MLKPKTVYKYLIPGRIDVLQNSQMRFTQATAFNDPFETRPSVTSVFDLDTLKERAVEAIRKNPKLAILVVPVWPMMEGVLGLDSAGRRQNAAEFMQSLLDSNFGCLSLAAPEDPDSGPDNLLMWAHYADCHRGFALGFDASNPFFDQQQPTRPYFGVLTPVRYTLDRPSGFIVDDIGNLESAIYYQIAVKFFLVKSKHWQYEREHRMVMPLSEASKTLEIGGEEICLFDFPPAALKEVVLGCRISAETEERVKEVLGADHYRHVAVRRAEIDLDEFRLKISKDTGREAVASSDFGTLPVNPDQRTVNREIWSKFDDFFQRKRE